MPEESIPGDVNRRLLSISVIIITHNEEKNIKESLDSLMDTDYPPERFEILVIDASTDSTPDIAGEYDRIRLIRSKKGFSRQRNLGIEKANYDILAFVDADGFVAEDWLKTLNAAFQNPRVDAIGGNSFPPPKTGYFGLCVACIGHPAGGAIGFDANVTRSEKGIEFVAGCNCAFRREALADVGGFDPDFNDGGEDLDISRRLRQRGHYLDYIQGLNFYHIPRKNIWEYIRWNIGVGVTKYNLTRPSFIGLILHPFFPLWSLLFLFLLIFLVRPIEILGFILLLCWVFFLLVLYLKTKPFPLLIQRRKKIGISLISISTVIAFLIYLRQIFIHMGQIYKFFKQKFPSGL
jgi:GT2 family glycosyltransferase